MNCMIKSRRCVRNESRKQEGRVYIIDLVAWQTSTEQAQNRYRTSTVLRTDRFRWRYRVIFAVEISGVSWAWQRSWTLWILQTYCRYIADILPQIAADCGGKRQIVMEGVTGCVP